MLVNIIVVLHAVNFTSEDVEECAVKERKQSSWAEKQARWIDRRRTRLLSEARPERVVRLKCTGQMWQPVSDITFRLGAALMTRNKVLGIPDKAGMGKSGFVMSPHTGDGSLGSPSGDRVEELASGQTEGMRPG